MPEDLDKLRDELVAGYIRQGECPFKQLKPGQTIAHCPLGFPGCYCADEIEANPYLADIREARDKDFEAYMKDFEAYMEDFEAYMEGEIKQP